MDLNGQGARFSNVPGRVQAGLKTSVKNDSFWSETVGSRLGEPGGTPQPRITRRTTLYGFLGSQARFCDTRISSIILKRHRGFYEASKRMTNKKIDVESALYYNVRLPNLKSIYNNIW